MAKLMKSSENTWNVIDDDAVLVDGVIDGEVVNKRRPTNDEEMPILGEVYLNEADVMFIPETWRGIEHTANHLREIADLMDGLLFSSQQPIARLTGKSADGRRTYIQAAAAGKL